MLNYYQGCSSIMIGEEPVKADEFFKEIFDKLPRGSAYLLGMRLKNGLTQKQLGEMVDVAQYNISKMERGKRPIGKKIAQRFAKAFETDYRLFL